MNAASSTATGIGSGIFLIWIWNRVLAAIWNHFVAPESWPEMPAEVAAGIAPVFLALVDRYVIDIMPDQPR